VKLEGLKRRRTSARVSLESAGAWIGVSKQHFSKLEAGSSPLDIQRARVIAERLGCTIEGLF
jgi:transcriptional regulator with XRE-family HTH domain